MCCVLCMQRCNIEGASAPLCGMVCCGSDHLHHVVDSVTMIRQEKCFETPLTSYNSGVQSSKSKFINVPSVDTYFVQHYQCFEVYKNLVHMKNTEQKCPALKKNCGCITKRCVYNPQRSEVYSLQSRLSYTPRTVKI